MKLEQLKPLACHTRAHCKTCRTDADWRERVTGVRHFPCPYRGLRPGNVVYYISKITLLNRLVKNKSCGCAKRRKRWNELGWRGCLKRILSWLTPT